MTDPPEYEPPDYGGQYSWDQVRAAANAAADLILAEPFYQTEYSVTIRDRSLIDLLVNTAMTLLDGTASTLDDVIRLNYSTEPDEVKGWLWSTGR